MAEATGEVAVVVWDAVGGEAGREAREAGLEGQLFLRGRFAPHREKCNVRGLEVWPLVV
jgi:hypothetical protein